MAGTLRTTFKSFVHLAQPSAGTLSLRSFSVGAAQLADKSPVKDTKPASPPKPAAPVKPAPPSSKGDTYQSQEYYGFNEFSYYELESDMRKSRLPQPTPGTPCD